MIARKEPALIHTPQFLKDDIDTKLLKYFKAINETRKNVGLSTDLFTFTNNKNDITDSKASVGMKYFIGDGQFASATIDINLSPKNNNPYARISGYLPLQGPSPHIHLKPDLLESLAISILVENEHRVVELSHVNDLNICYKAPLVTGLHDVWNIDMQPCGDLWSPGQVTAGLELLIYSQKDIKNIFQTKKEIDPKYEPLIETIMEMALSEECHDENVSDQTNSYYNIMDSLENSRKTRILLQRKIFSENLKKLRDQ
jgi:hypothetical protein